ncbi:OmpA family protein [Vibrio vulnificus]|uniref:OmpA family protein n=1 Tax=Vibrio vulnificus TaxID=672 RepID=UPI001A1A52B6|nr:OmpA family protein [Vibrio vulnificus]EGQ7692823.1 OmpA family protein [Vibrio vulnificus]EGR0072431.1 OmpA family protein [Vibrio vulnificus]EGR7976069.1 OmpA family protein [Vibrio vulnificus]EHD2235245.1 OmpA family protein [Vibrio vulnificus]EHK8987053.1 OmpA family protein [Vibrio vulnificus]
MKAFILPLVCLTFAATSVIASDKADEYDYLATPRADQVADLQDQDRDGVINARDLCPDTPSTAEIDNDGCGTYVKTSQQMQIRVLFANDSDKINPVFRKQIKEMSEFLKLYPSTSIELQGYASRTGNAEHNLDLSKRRADNVREMLIGYGIAQSRVRIVGFGDSVLVNEGTDEVSHALNRRVVASVVGYKGDVKEEWTIFTSIPKAKK